MTKKDVCIIVPYRNRAEHLSKFAPYLDKFLTEENLTHDIFIIEQTEEKPFNRAKLLNVGFELTKGKYKNYVFHDVDMLPIKGKASYAVVTEPTHYATLVEQFGWNLAYNEYFGGVTAFDEESFLKVNGYCNEFWGWGAEDDDMFGRCKDGGFNLSRRTNMYSSLDHERIIDNKLYHKNLDILNKRLEWRNEGLKTLQYTILETEENTLYTKIKVEI
jgi:hypothetical protein